MIGTISDAIGKFDAIAKTTFSLIEALRESRHIEIQT